jgi:AraC-like DNA-binding protein
MAPWQDARMTYRECSPSPPLNGLVAAYWGIDNAVDGEPTVQKILPDGCADLICDFSGWPHMRWVGTMTRAIEVAAGGPRELFGIRFAPGGLFPLLGAPLSLLTDDSVPFGALPAPLWRPPLQEWCEDSSFAARCRLADTSLLAMLPRLQSATIAGALRRLSLQPVLPSTAAALADDIGVGLRTLQRRFMDQLGVSPRQHLRYLRFERARQLLLQRDHRAADIAAIAGYSDQAHFVREFRRFTGVTPGRWR